MIFNKYTLINVKQLTTNTTNDIAPPNDGSSREMRACPVTHAKKDVGLKIAGLFNFGTRFVLNSHLNFISVVIILIS